MMRKEPKWHVLGCSHQMLAMLRTIAQSRETAIPSTHRNHQTLAALRRRDFVRLVGEHVWTATDKGHARLTIGDAYVDGQTGMAK